MTYPTTFQPFWWLFAGTRGGPTRVKILETLKRNPQNTNQLAHLLKMDYKTVKHHLDLLQKNKIVVCEGDYGATYFLSQVMEDNYGLVEKVLRLPKKEKRAKIFEK